MSYRVIRFVALYPVHQGRRTETELHTGSNDISPMILQITCKGRDDFKAAYRFSNQWYHDMVMSEVIVNEEIKYLLYEYPRNTNYEISNDLPKGRLLVNFVVPTELCIWKTVKTGILPIGIRKTEDVKELPAQGMDFHKGKQDGRGDL